MIDLKLKLIGPVSLHGHHGVDLTPSSMKARAILAILGTSSGLRQTRAKLQDKLWSDRAAHQGSASLRQTLAELRRTMGEYRDVLISGPGWVGLDPKRVCVVLHPGTNDNEYSVEFAEDLDIQDPEFEDWILLQRQHYSDLWARSDIQKHDLPGYLEDEDGHVAVLVRPSKSGCCEIDSFVDVVLRDAAMRAADLANLKVYTDQDLGALHSNVLIVEAHAFGTSQNITLHISLSNCSTKQHLSNQTFHIDNCKVSSQLRRVSAELTLSLLHAVSTSTPNPIGSECAKLPILDIFSFSKDRLLSAENILAHQPGIPSNLALRAYIRNTLLLERLTDTPMETREEATELATLAIEKAPQSATALSVAAMIAMRNKCFELSIDLADQAIRIDPANPLAWNSHSAALTFLGRHKEAYHEAIRITKEPLRKLCPASLLINCSIAAVRAGRLGDAVRHATLSHNYNRKFRPALRLLSALHFQMGNRAEAHKALCKLRQLEPDFSLELMASDDYPVATLRDMNLLGVTQSRLI